MEREEEDDDDGNVIGLLLSLSLFRFQKVLPGLLWSRMKERKGRRPKLYEHEKNFRLGIGSSIRDEFCRFAFSAGTSKSRDPLLCLVNCPPTAVVVAAYRLLMLLLLSQLHSALCIMLRWVKGVYAYAAITQQRAPDNGQHSLRRDSLLSRLAMLKY